jgi:Raf kinase inhibitor-like YbhB/YbcL family protein
MRISSLAFEHEGRIPSKYTVDGEAINPPLQFHDVPETAVSFVLLMDDPDVPPHIREDQMFDHWVVFNMPPDTREIDEASVPPGTVGLNTGGTNAYWRPAPPDREHRYFFKLYALDTMLDLTDRATKQDVSRALEGHIIEQAELMGRYQPR